MVFSPYIDNVYYLFLWKSEPCWVFFLSLYFYFDLLPFKINKFIYLFIYFYFWLHWVFVAACGLALVAASGSYFWLWCWASHCCGFSCCRAQALGSQASVVVAHGPSSCGSRTLECRLSSCGARA